MVGVVKVYGSCPICEQRIEHKRLGIMWEHEFRLIKWWHCLVKHKKWIFNFKWTVKMILITLVGYPLCLIYFLLKVILFPFWWVYENL